MISDSYEPRTVQRRISTLKCLMNHCGITDPTTLTEDHVRDFLTHFPYEPWSVIAYLRDIRFYARYAGIPDPTERIRRPRKPEGLPDPLPEPALELLQREAGKLTDPTFLQWINLGAFEGFRASDTAFIECENFEMWSDEIRLTGKGNKEDVLPLAPVVRRCLGKLPHGTGRLYPDIDPEDVSTEIAIFANHFGIRMRYHQLRHRFGTVLYRTTRDLLLTKRLMRHRSIQSTLNYAKLYDPDAVDAIRNLPGAN